MATKAKQILQFPTNQQNRAVETKRHPDTISLALELQTTLSIESQLKILFNEIANYIPLDGASYVNKELKMNHRIADIARHSCSYNLTLLDNDLGTLEFSRSDRFEEDHLEIIEYLLSAALYPLKNAVDYQKALKLAHRDPLTGISNRLSMTETLQREVNRAQRYDLPLTMLMIDLDHFKSVNDNYGHSTGDAVLKEAVNCIQQGLRISDQPFRFGGEEFVVLLADTNADDARVVAERIRGCIEANTVINNEFVVRFTASIGLAELKPQDNEQTLFDHADKALYTAKNEGRNRVVSWNESTQD